MTRRALARTAAVVAVTTTLAACADPGPPAADPVRPAWREVTLPLPAGAAGRPVLRDAAWCPGRWYAVGAVAAPGGATTPAAWSSPDALTWTPLRLSPTTFYGRRGVLTSAACHGDRLAAVGAQVGGVHGNPRVSTWRGGPAALAEVAAGFEVFGGPAAVSTGRIAAGPAGWLIVGNRTGGAAVWRSPDAAAFTLVEDAPDLASDAAGATWAHDAVWGPGGWLVVGALTRPGRRDRDPLAWTSADGDRWARAALPGTGGREEPQRVALAGGGTPVAVGARGAGFGAWRRQGAGWVAAGRFGAAATTGVAAVRGLAVTRGGLLAAVSDGAAHALWISGDLGRSWQVVISPALVPARGDAAVAVASDAARVLLLADDGRGARAWIAPAPARPVDPPA